MPLLLRPATTCKAIFASIKLGPDQSLETIEPVSMTAALINGHGGAAVRSHIVLVTQTGRRGGTMGIGLKLWTTNCTALLFSRFAVDFLCVFLLSQHVQIPMDHFSLYTEAVTRTSRQLWGRICSAPDRTLLPLPFQSI
jgi:hypothetical protein